MPSPLRWNDQFCKWLETDYETAINGPVDEQKENDLMEMDEVDRILAWRPRQPPTAPVDELKEKSDRLDRMLESMKTADQEQLEEILVALEELVPAAASLNLSSPISEDAWQVASWSLVHPVIDIRELGICRASMLERILRSSTVVRDNTRFIEGLLNRVLLPCVARLKEETKRWTSIFLQHNNIDPLQVELAPLPGNAVVWDIIIMGTCGSGHMPVSLLEEVMEWYTFNQP